MRTIGTSAFGIRTPIIKRNDDVVEIIVDSILNSKINVDNLDILCITESLIARAQNNYIKFDSLTKEFNNKFKSDSVGVVFPILSRNRFLHILKALANTKKEIYILLSYPNDEVGNPLISKNELRKANLNPYKKVLNEIEFKNLFPNTKHPFTNIDYIDLYKSVGKNINIFFSNNELDMLKFSDNILVANVHERNEVKNNLLNNNAKLVLTLEDILTTKNSEGYNPEFGLMGSNLAKDDEIKLFPRDSKKYVFEIQKKIHEKTNKLIEVMVFGDGAFKDPVHGIWEFADPVVSPAYTNGLIGTPNELKLKFIADNEFENLNYEETQKLIKEKIKNKKESSLGTTPRQITDLLGSLADLVCGSGDKGTPIVLIKGYFDNYSDN